MKTLDLKQMGVQEMDAMEAKRVDGGLSPYQNGVGCDKHLAEGLDTIGSFLLGVFVSIL